MLRWKRLQATSGKYERARGRGEQRATRAETYVVKGLEVSCEGTAVLGRDTVLSQMGMLRLMQAG